MTKNKLLKNFLGTALSDLSSRKFQFNIMTYTGTKSRRSSLIVKRSCYGSIKFAILYLHFLLKRKHKKRENDTISLNFCHENKKAHIPNVR